MAFLFTQGIFLAIGLAISLILLIISVFVGHIIFFDSLLVGVAVFAALLFLQNTRFGFWAIGLLMSAVWAFIFAFFAYIFAGEDMIWFYVVLGLAFIVMVGLHIKARSNE